MSGSQAVGGSFIPLSIQSPYRINPFDLPKAIRGDDAGTGEVLRAGLAATDEKLRTKRREVIEIAKATIEGLEFTLSQPRPTIDVISRWMNLSAAQAAKTTS